MSMSSVTSGMSSASRVQHEPGSWSEIMHEVQVGFVVGAMHSWYFIDKFLKDQIAAPVQSILGLESSEPSQTQAQEGKEKTLKVVGVGYGRTGTYSLTLALEELGYPTLHTQHMYEHAEVFGMWIDQVFQPSIDEGEANLRKPNLDLIVERGFQATCDLPTALYYEQIMEEFPEAKFILTTRSNSEEWFRSWDTLTKSITQPARFGNFVPAVRPIMIYLRWLFATVNKDPMYLSAPYPLPNQQKEASIASYEEHNRKVRELIPQDRLLEYSVKEGWEPLCKFLELDSCPTTPFPKTNSARSVRVQAISSFIVPFSIVFFIICVVFVRVFRQVTGTTPIDWFNWKIRAAMLALSGKEVPVRPKQA